MAALIRGWKFKIITADDCTLFCRAVKRLGLYYRHFRTDAPVFKRLAGDSGRKMACFGVGLKSTLPIEEASRLLCETGRNTLNSLSPVWPQRGKPASCRPSLLTDRPLVSALRLQHRTQSGCARARGRDFGSSSVAQPYTVETVTVMSKVRRSNTHEQFFFPFRTKRALISRSVL